MHPARTLLLRSVLAVGLVATGWLGVATTSSAAPAPSLRPMLRSAPFVGGGIAVDAAGDVFETDPFGGQVMVIPAATGTIFGQSVEQGVEVPLAAATGLNGPSGIALDAAGDLYIANAGYADSISVLPAATTTLFGQSVVADQITTLSAASGIITPMGIAVDAAGDLLVASQSLGEVAVVAGAATTVLGQPVAADTTTFLPSTKGLVGDPTGLALDGAGDLFVAGDGQIAAVANESTTLFGQSFSPDQAAVLTASTTLASELGTLGDLEYVAIAVDASGDLFVNGHASNGDVEVGVLPGPTSSAVLGQSVTASQPTVLSASTVGPAESLDIAVDAAGDLVVGDSLVGPGDSARPGIAVIPAASGTFCGTAVVAGQRTFIPDPALLVAPQETFSAGAAVAVDATGDAFTGSNTTDGVVVVPSATGTLFGQAVTRGIPAVLQATAGMAVDALAIDGAGDLVVAGTTKGSYDVLAPDATTFLGQHVAADVLTPITALASTAAGVGLSFDTAGDLLGETVGRVFAVASTAGTLYGHATAAGKRVWLLTGVEVYGGMAVDPAGNLFLLVWTGDGIVVKVLAPVAGDVLGVSMPADTLTLLPTTSTGDDLSLATTPQGDLLIGVQHDGDNGSDGEVDVVASSSRTLYGVPVSADVSTTLEATTGTGGVLDAVPTPGNGLDVLTMTGLWSLGGIAALLPPTTIHATIGKALSATLTTFGGLATPTITMTGSLPPGLSFTDNGDGTATVAGTPAAGSPKTTVITVTVEDPVTLLSLPEEVTIDVAAHDTLFPGQSVWPHHPLVSRSGVYELVLSGRGNLVLKTAGGRHLWSSHTAGSGAVRATFTHHGVLKLVNGQGIRVGRVGTAAADPQRLRLLNTGDLVARAGGVRSWHTNTAQPVLCTPLDATVSRPACFG